MSDLKAKEKFIAFIDILGFKNMVSDSESGSGRTSLEIKNILNDLARNESVEFFRADGPKICPMSNYLRKDLDFQITQVSDCVVVSCEISPAGAINIVQHCWAVAMALLIKGVMVRGYITRGLIVHESDNFWGTGYQDANSREPNVSVFKREADEKGTPFIEIDLKLSNYIKSVGDVCVQEMFNRFVKSDGEMTAIFPFKLIKSSFNIGGNQTDFAVERRNNKMILSSIQNLKELINFYIDLKNPSAVRKLRHYIDALDAQMAICNDIDRNIEKLYRSFDGRRT